MQILIVGYGSIGKRHYEILSTLQGVTNCDLITKQEIPKVQTYKTLQECFLEKYDYIVIASQTSLHYEQLVYLEHNTKNKIILVEKPLFDEDKDLEIINNKVFIAYNRRFYPILQEIKKLCNKDKCYYAHVITGQYLPQWRPLRDYQQTYSSKKKEGGGVVLDLSHELDYLYWIFPSWQIITSLNTKISDLEIDTDDLCVVLGKADKTVINMSIDYISKKFKQDITIHLQESSLYADLVSMKLLQVFKDKSQKEYDFSQYTKNYSFEKMHCSLLFENQESCCTYDEGVKIMRYIKTIKENQDESLL